MTKTNLASTKDWPKWLIRAWLKDADTSGAMICCSSDVGDGDYFLVRTKEGLEVINEDDWIIHSETKCYLEKMNRIDFRNTYFPHVKAPDGHGANLKKETQ